MGFRVDGTNRNMYDNVMGNQQMSERPIIAQASYPIRPFNPIFGNKGGQGGQDRTGVVEKFPFYNDLGNQQMSERQMFNPIFARITAPMATAIMAPNRFLTGRCTP